LLPTINMDAVTAKLEVGLSKIRDSIAALSLKIAPQLDYSALNTTKAALNLRWHIAAENVLGAGDVFAYERYLTWHSAAFKKALDPPYVPVPAELDTPVLEEGPITRSRSRARSTTRRGGSRAPKKSKSNSNSKSKGVVKRVKV
jgi:hypothetical protein